MRDFLILHAIGSHPELDSGSAQSNYKRKEYNLIYERLPTDSESSSE